jgi:VanZ family protein
VLKTDSYIKYLQIVNPRYAVLYNDKDAKFRKRHRWTDIIVFYLLSSFMLFMSVSMPNTTLTIPHGNLVYLMLVAVLFSILVWIFSLFILKKSKNNSSFWFYFIGLVLFMILVLCFLV